ncbi:hypothetical protein BLA55_02460 [Mycoplasmopsis pullorum]|uniref:Phage portal protein n=2 Tax=Mycoplasmopsis pullorum TaxID=48003 RepID=A0A1L4FSC7_9BACT|nr:hypothetical protein BLA55_02460 [Mycoplasmopsis pullorum]
MSLNSADIYVRFMSELKGHAPRDGLYKDGKYTKPDSKTQFLEDGANVQVISLATDTPKVTVLDNEQLTQQLRDFLDQQGFLELIQKMEYKLYKQGIQALGIRQNGRIVLANVVRYETDENNELTKLTVHIENDDNNNPSDLENFEEWDVSDKSDKINKRVLIKSKNEVHDLEKITGQKYEYKQSKKIPYVIFKNDANARSDIQKVNDEFFELLNVKLESLLLDVFYSLPIPEIISNQKGSAGEKTTRAMFSLDTDRLIKSSTYETRMTNGSTFDIHQANTQALPILQTIENIKTWIKSSLQSKKDSSDYGTKNMHTAEVQGLNSDFEDLIESKANLRQIYYKKLMLLICEFIFNQIAKIDVMVVGSSKWLDEQANKLQANQNGVNITNPNAAQTINEAGKKWI